MDCVGHSLGSLHAKKEQQCGGEEEKGTCEHDVSKDTQMIGSRKGLQGVRVHNCTK